MDKNFIEENKFNDDVERFKQLFEYKSPKQSLKKLYEYTFVTKGNVNEDGEQDEEGNMQQSDPNQMGGAPQADMNNMPPQGQQMPSDASNQMDGGMGQPMENMPPQGQQMDMNGMPPQDMQQPPMNDAGAMPMGDMGVADGSDENIETQEMEPDDEVIDVDDLTQSQEATEYKIDGVDDRLSKIYAVVQKFSDQLDKNAEDIKDLKTEFEKRNPTEEEKLNLRSQSSYPYSETPKGYWENKVKENPHYNVMYDNEVSPSEEQNKFEIKRSDISGLNMKDISDSLDIDQNLKDYIGF